MRGVLILVLGLLAAPAAALSLYPDRSSRDLLAGFDGLETWQPRLVFRRWQPYGLPGVAVDGVEFALGQAGLELSAEALREDWGVLSARRLRLGLLAALSPALRLGLAAERDAIAAGAASRQLSLLASLGAPLALSLRLPLAGEPGAALLGLGYAGPDWALRAWRAADAEGLAWAWRPEGLELELIASSAGWQALALRVGGGRWRLALEERRHAWLGGSHGLRLELR